MIPAAVSQIFNTGIFFEADRRCCLRALMTTQNLQCVQTHYIIQLSNPFEKVLWNSEKSHFATDIWEQHDKNRPMDTGPKNKAPLPQRCQALRTKVNWQVRTNSGTILPVYSLLFLVLH